MKHIIFFTGCLVLTWLISIASCKKDREVQPRPNLAPVARAGSDISVQLSSCSDRSGIAELDGSASSDPDGNVASYFWTKIYGPPGEIISNPSSAKARIEHISPGEYVFELVVNDVAGLASRDTVLLIVKGEPREYDLDITFNSTYIFQDSTTNCATWYDYYAYCEYKSTSIFGRGFFSPMGEFTIYVSEQDVTDATGNTRNSFIHIYLDNINNVFISGDCSVNFKNLIQQGGGSFTGTSQISNGSALVCDPPAFANLSALTVSGNLDFSAKTVTLRVEGKAYF
jgi:hypothetical protein